MILLRVRTFSEDGGIAAIVVTFIEPEADNNKDATNHCLFNA